MLIFFDNSYVDLSFKTRLSRQLRQCDKIITLHSSKLKTLLETISSKIYWFRRNLKEKFSHNKWHGKNIEISGLSHSSIGSIDLTIDQYINKHGGIFSHADNKMHYSKRSYLDGIKASGCHIKDYK